VSVLGTVDTNWTTLHYDDCKELLPLLRELKIPSTLGDVKPLTEIFCEKTFLARFEDLLPYPIFEFQQSDLKRRLGILMDFDVVSVSKILQVLSAGRAGNPEIWKYLYEYLRDAQRDYKMDGIMVRVDSLYVPGHLADNHQDNFVALGGLRWKGDEEVASLGSVVLLAQHFPDTYFHLFTKVFGVAEGLSVADHIESIKSLCRAVIKKGFQSKEFSDLLLAYSGLSELLHFSAKSTLYPLDGLPVLIERGKNVKDFEIYRADEQRPGEILPYIDDW